MRGLDIFDILSLLSVVNVDSFRYLSAPECIFRLYGECGLDAPYIECLGVSAASRALALLGTLCL